MAETTGKAVEVSHGENSSKITEDLVAHQKFSSTNISLEQRENNILTTKNENQGTYGCSLVLFEMGYFMIHQVDTGTGSFF